MTNGIQEILAAAQSENRAQLHGLPEHHVVVDGNKAVIVFAWADAPPTLQSYGKGNWLALVPAGYQHDLSWIEQSPYFASESVDVYVLPTGQKVYVGT